MGQFSDETKHWLHSVIKQRKVLIRLNQSHISQAKAETAIGNLETQLNAYPYDHDVYMARLIRQHVQDIDTILPGSGSTCHEKRQREFADIRKRAILIEERFRVTVSNVIKVRGL